MQKEVTCLNSLLFVNFELLKSENHEYLNI